MAVLDPRNIVADGPDVFALDPAASHAAFSLGAEASPIYLTVDASVAVSGSYTVGTVTREYSGSTSVTQRTRAAIRTDAEVDSAGENYEIKRDHGDSNWGDFGVLMGGASNTFSAVHWNPMGCNGGTPPFAPPTFVLDSFIVEYVDGTETDTAPDPDTETPITVEVSVVPPFFTGSIQDGDLKMLVRLIAVENGVMETFDEEIDASAWTVTDFRDIRGTYGTTSTDSNGIEYTWSITIA